MSEAVGTVTMSDAQDLSKSLQGRKSVNIVSAIAACIGSIGKLSKASLNQHQKYKFTSIDDFLAATGKACCEHGLIILQDELKREVIENKLPIDNNECEQLMKQAAVARKNWLFCGSLAGGERSAGFMTLVSSAHRNDLDVWAYVNDVLARMLAGETDYQPLLPWNWAKDHPESIREYRQEERRERDVRKQTHRAKRRANKKRQARLNRK